MLKYLFLSYLFSAVVKYWLIRLDIHGKGSKVVLKAFDVLSLLFNAFLTRIFLKELGRGHDFSPCLYLWKFFPTSLKPILAGNTLCTMLVVPAEKILLSATRYLDMVVEVLLPAWKFVFGIALIFKPMLLLVHYSVLGSLFLSFLVVEPIVLFSNILSAFGNFASNSEVMLNRGSMVVALIISAAMTWVSFTVLYSSTVSGPGYVLPSELGLCIWLLVGFTCSLGISKIFVQSPEKDGYLWTVPQFACLLVYQISTVLGICEVVMNSGSISIVDLWKEGTRIGVFTGTTTAIRLISQLVLVLSIVFTHLYAYYPEFVETITFWIYPTVPEDDEIPEDVTVSFYLTNMLKGLLIFSKPIFVGCLYLYLSPSSGQAFSTTQDLLSYPAWLVLISFFANVISSCIFCIYFFFVHDPISAEEDQEVERFLQKINNGAF
ncbi:hypothetical protein DSO57_1018515 [Entomophthora muscae]|uniref:Uncharacterized protein n=1 Tax=Entomophthora muscae TaxID=34485 RepID=A0ACC2T4C1_9FUNG|nr:hypothetical protein DSO57_1018515 [Entomophthora muscae]